MVGGAAVVARQLESRGGLTLVMSYASTCDIDCQNLLHSIGSRMISGHQKHLACWIFTRVGGYFQLYWSVY